MKTSRRQIDERSKRSAASVYIEKRSLSSRGIYIHIHIKRKRELVEIDTSPTPIVSTSEEPRSVLQTDGHHHHRRDQRFPQSVQFQLRLSDAQRKRKHEKEIERSRELSGLKGSDLLNYAALSSVYLVYMYNVQLVAIHILYFIGCTRDRGMRLYIRVMLGKVKYIDILYFFFFLSHI